MTRPETEEAAWEIVAEYPPVREVIPPGTERVLGRNRDLGADLILHDVTVARRHAVLRNRGGALEIQDLESHCGIFVNERSGGYRGRVHLADGDEIRIGQVRLRARRLAP